MSHSQYRSLVQQAITRPRQVVRHTRPPTLPTTKAPRAPEAPPPEVEPLQPQSLPPNELYIDKALPPEVAILHVYADGSDKYRLWGNTSHCGLLEDGPHKRPHLSLGEMTEPSQKGHQARYPKQIRGIMINFSRSRIRRQLRDWFKNLYSTKPQSLIIADHTNFEIPWEMFELSRNKYLGAVVATARWLHVVGEDDTDLFLQVEPNESRGGIIAFVDSKGLKATRTEFSLLKKMDALISKNADDFCQQLEDDRSEIGLVYMACHGYFDPRNIFNIALVSKEHKGQRIGLLELQEQRLRLIERSRSIVFINACHSGRLIIDEEYAAEQTQRGFSELFLSRGARGIIATLGGVGNSHAAQTADLLIKSVMAEADNQTSVAEILRRIRAKTVDKLSKNSKNENSLAFLYTFMYVYYGNPMTTLRLTKREG